MAQKVTTITKYFPCARAPYTDATSGDGQHRLWSEYNITNIFNFLFDIDGAQCALLSYNKKKISINGYIFESSTDFTQNYYWIIVDTTANELIYDTDQTAVLYSGSTESDKPSASSGQAVYGGKIQTIKFDQFSIADVNLNQTSRS